MVVKYGSMVLDALDDVWRQANAFVDQMPDDLIEQHKPRLTALFTIHTMTLKSEIEKRIPDGSAKQPLAVLDETLEFIKEGNLREALRNLALGVIASAPPSPQSMDPAFEDLFERSDDKSIALIQSVDRNGVGIMPLTLRLMFKSEGQGPEEFYRNNLDRAFPNPKGIVPVIQ